MTVSPEQLAQIRERDAREVRFTDGGSVFWLEPDAALNAAADRRTLLAVIDQLLPDAKGRETPGTLKHWDADRGHFIVYEHHYDSIQARAEKAESQLAEAKAEIERMREALKDVRSIVCAIPDESTGPSAYRGCVIAINKIDAALSLLPKESASNTK